MKKYLTILSLIITSTSFAQQKFTVKVQGGSSSDSLSEKLAEKLDISYKDSISANSVAIEGKADTSNVTQTADYIIEKVGSTIYARPGFKSGLPAYSNTSFNTVITSAMGQLVNGGKIFIKAGLYDNLDVIKIPYDHITIEGAGKYLTVLKLRANADSGIIYGFGLINISNDAFGGTAQANYFTIKNIELDGNGANQTKIDNGASTTAKVSGVYSDNNAITNVVIDNCYIHDFTSFGVILNNAYVGAIHNNKFEHNYWNNVTLSTLTKFITVDNNFCLGGGDVSITSYGTGITIRNNVIDSVTGTHGSVNSHWGIAVEGGAVERNKIINNIISGAVYGIALSDSSSFCEVTGNTIHDLSSLAYGGYALLITHASNTLVNNNKIYNNTHADAIVIMDNSIHTNVLQNDIYNSLQGIHIYTSYNTVMGNTISSPLQGINIEAGGDNNIIMGNISQGANSSNDIVNAGSANIFKSNFQVEANAWFPDTP